MIRFSLFGIAFMGLAAALFAQRDEAADPRPGAAGVVPLQGAAPVRFAVTKVASRSPDAGILGTRPPGANIVTYGGDPAGTADSCAAKDAALASFGSGPAVLQFPPGLYKFGCAIAVADRSIAIEGLGPGISRLRFDSAAPDQAGIRISQDRPDYLVRIEHLSIFSGVAQTAGNAAISVTYPAHGGTGPKNVTFSDLEIGYGNSLSAYWSDGIRCATCTAGYLSNVNIHGRNEGNPPAGISALNMSAGVALSGYSTGFTMVGLNVTTANYGVYAKGDSEGQQQFGCGFTSVNYGWFFDDGTAGDPTSIPQAPGPEISDCNTATYKGGFLSKGWTQTTITGGAVFYKRPESTNDWVGVSLLDGTFGATKVGSNLNIISGGNQFYGFYRNRGTGGRAEAVRLGSLASGNLVQGNSINFVDTAFHLLGGGTNRLTDNQGYFFGEGWVAAGLAPAAVVARNEPVVIGTDPAIARLPAGATPGIGGFNQKVFATANSKTTVIIAIQGGYAGEEIRVRGGDGGHTVLGHNAQILLKGGMSVTLADGHVVTLLDEGAYWEEVARNF